jgi:hypothetical protein
MPGAWPLRSPRLGGEKGVSLPGHAAFHAGGVGRFEHFLDLHQSRDVGAFELAEFLLDLLAF